MSRLTAAFFVTVVVTVLLPIANLAVINTLARTAHVVLRSAGWLRRDAQAVGLI